MIKKVEKPTVRDFRTEEHLIRNNLVLDNQIGFKKGGRIEYNNVMLQFVVEKTSRSGAKYHSKLIVVALDFKKAYDSIDRRKLIEVLIKYKINPYMIDIIAKVYNGDETIVRMGNREEKIK